MSASMNVTIMTPGLTAFHMPGSDSNFSNSIKNDFVEFSVFFAVQNLCSTVPKFT